MRRLLLLLLAATPVLMQTSAQTIPQPLQVSRIYNITSAATVIDNRSQQSMGCNYFSFYVLSGTGSWSAQLEYSDTSNTGPWTAFSNGAIASLSSGATIGYANGYHNWIHINTTVGTTVTNFSCSKDYYISTSATGGGAPSVSYLAPYTGAQSYTVQAKLNNYLSITDFGAVPGTLSSGTDNSTALAAAMTAANSQSKTVYVPDGIWWFATPWSITAPLVCQSHNSVLDYTGGGSSYALSWGSTISNLTAENCAFQSNGSGVVAVNQANEVKIRNFYVTRGNSGVAFFNNGTQQFRCEGCVMTVNGSQINPTGAIPTYGYLGQDGGGSVVNSSKLIDFIAEGAQTCGICSSTVTTGQGYFEILGAVVEGTSGGPNLQITGSQLVNAYGLHMEAGHGSGPNGTTNKDWIISSSNNVHLTGDYVGNGYITGSLATKVDATEIPQLDIDTTSYDTNIDSVYLEYNNGYFNDLGVNTTVNGATSTFNPNARVGNQMNSGRTVLNPNGDMERWVASATIPDGFFAYGGATLARVGSGRSGSYATQVTATTPVSISVTNGVQQINAVLTVSTTTGLSQGLYIVLAGAPTCSPHTGWNGAWEITNVNAGASQVTINNPVMPYCAWSGTGTITNQYQGLGFDLAGAFASEALGPYDWVTVHAFATIGSTTTNKIGILANINYIESSNLQVHGASIPANTWYPICRSVQMASNGTGIIVLAPNVPVAGGEVVTFDDVEISKGRGCSADLDYGDGTFSQIWFGPQGSTKRITQGTAPPSGGNALAGDLVINSAPSIGTPLIFAASAAGSPGTWISGTGAPLHSNASYTTTSALPAITYGTDAVYLCNATSGAITLTLPSAAGTASAPSYIRIIKDDVTANACTITAYSSSDYLNGTSGGSFILAGPAYVGVTLATTGNNYWWAFPSMNYAAGVASAVQTSGTVTVTPNVTLYVCNSSGGNITYDLPPAVSYPPAIYTFKKIASSNSCTITPNGLDDIDGANSSLTLSTQYTYYTVQSGATGYWWIVAQH